MFRQVCYYEHVQTSYVFQGGYSMAKYDEQVKQLLDLLAENKTFRLCPTAS